MSLRIGIFVHGRFHAFNLAGALTKAGADVTVFTNYPPWIVRRFSKDVSYPVRTFWTHGLVSRVLAKIQPNTPWVEAFTHRMFGRWAARQLRHFDLDVVDLLSGIAEEPLLFLRRKKPGQLAVVGRLSAHIRKQRELLMEEQNRAGVPMEIPSLWRVAREEREYELASAVYAPSRFSLETLRAAGIPEDRLVLAPFGVEVDAFRPTPEEAAARVERIASGAPLRVLTVGTLSFRKGAIDYQEVVQRSRNSLQFRFVGTVTEECRQMAADLNHSVEFIGRVPEWELRAHYNWADLFFFPTIEEGFAQVLSQAYAANLPIVTTQNSGADLITDGKTGWIVPIRDFEQMSARLLWCHQNRAEIVEMCGAIAAEGRNRSWDDMARDYLAAVRRLNDRPALPQSQSDAFSRGQHPPGRL